MTEIRDHSQMQQNPDSNPETVLRKKIGEIVVISIIYVKLEDKNNFLLHFMEVHDYRVFDYLIFVCEVECRMKIG